MSVFGSEKLRAVYERYTLNRNSLSEIAPVVYEEYISPANSLLGTAPVQEPKTCPNCYASYDTPDSTICWNCGADLVAHSRIGEVDQTRSETHQEVETRHSEKGERPISIGKCMVCRFDLKDNEEAIWCPRCGTMAHKAHFLEWLHVKHCCPACNERLNEERLRQLM
jgi:hypothetical protein